MLDLYVHALGCDVAVHSDTVSVGSAVADLCADLRVTRPDRCDAHVHVVGDRPWQIVSPAHQVDANTVPAAVGQVLAAVNVTAVHATRLLALHAAVLSKDGAVVALPAESGTGKSTLTAMLVAHHGWTYHSDESLALPWADAAPIAYPRPLSLSDWSAKYVGVSGYHDGTENIIGAKDLGHWSWTVPGPLTHVVVLRRDRENGGGCPSGLVEATAAETVEALVTRSFTHFLDPGKALTVYGAIAARCQTSCLWLTDPERDAQALDTALSSQQH